MHDFIGKVALVTGGGVGIGRATALAFASAGAKVVIGNRNVERGIDTVERIRSAGGEAVFLRTDVTAAADVEALVALAVSEYGALDCAFNNAGIFASLSPITEDLEQDFDRVMATNAKGVWLSMKYELKQMLKQGRGTIVNNASVGGLIGSPKGTASYTASKHAVIGLTKAAALENARRGIRVNAVAPAVIDTDMGTSFAGELEITIEDFGRMHPIGRVGQPEEVAAAVLWLCSEQSSFMLGHTLILDGGYTAQ
jgi:NAD(P)-dependent dehydrogenase (short-subunit alcohol dehydrogenase family)